MKNENLSNYLINGIYQTMHQVEFNCDKEYEEILYDLAFYGDPDYLRSIEQAYPDVYDSEELSEIVGQAKDNCDILEYLYYLDMGVEFIKKNKDKFDRIGSFLQEEHYQEILNNITNNLDDFLDDYTTAFI